MSWQTFNRQEANKEYFQKLKEQVQYEYDHYTCFPPKEKVFEAFTINPKNIKCVILGQDPYHEPGQAMGLAFSVPTGVSFPPSLKNIYKEIESDLGRPTVNPSGDLTPWVQQGVFLLNSVLTVRSGEAGSHASFGWQTYTDNVIRALNHLDQPIVFMLWGNYAQKKEILLNNPKHLVLKAVHPSPLSANRGFFGCKHFSKCNQYLKDNGLTEINW